MSNPLSTTDPTSIEELLDRDPLELTEEDFDETVKLLVVAFRKEREVWEEEKIKSRVTGKRVSGGTTKKRQKEEVIKKIRESSSAKIDISKMFK